ncbi:patatin-like phospholipase family protein [Massilia sp. P8910]|uniref:patatin-like phospholipase family protein n=1 Tax=Massilia antarctica TaxID=2765360 RepID=UPI001E29E6F9|nr:patatin-like phospholipase family protein [Massilia antarctica]MCE3605193.1 patatin-like phospholipase family protein [Massilia antarctica]
MIRLCVLFSTLCALGLGGCAISEVSNARNQPLAPQVLNEALAGPAPAVAGQMIRPDKPFVGVAISGGGSRAAVFSWSVLERLSALGILQHVDAISSVSGGSLSAATLVLNADHLGHADDWEAMRRALGQDLLTPWLAKLASPINWRSMATTDLERTHLMAQVFDERLFHGATFAQLDTGASRPALLLNATLASGKNAGDPFVFTPASFAHIGSRLDTYPVSHAVMASAAFPGVFGNITLKVFNDHDQKGDPVTTYTRIFDGGVADNLGLYTLLDFARARHASPAAASSPMRGCLLISIDAGTLNLDGELSAIEADTDHSVFDLLIKGTAWDAINGLMNINRATTLLEFGQDARRDQMRLESPRIFLPVTGEPPEHWRWEDLLDPVSTFALYGPRTRGQRQWSTPFFGATRESMSQTTGELTRQQVMQLVEAERNWRAQAPACKLWHVNFERLRALDSYVFQDGRIYTQKSEAPATAFRFKSQPLRETAHADGGMTSLRGFQYTMPLSGTVDLDDADVDQFVSINSYRASLWGFVSRVGTSFRLTGVPYCKPEQISRQLVAAADVLVTEDRSALQQVLTWFRAMNLPVFEPAPTRSRTMVDMPQIATTLLQTDHVGTIPLTTCLP